jgi:hypothetical protein
MRLGSLASGVRGGAVKFIKKAQPENSGLDLRNQETTYPGGGKMDSINLKMFSVPNEPFDKK